MLKEIVKRLMYPEGDDLSGVARVAGFLEISEWDLFREAYRWWFGKLPSNRVIDRAFSAYLVEEEIPFYVREFVRRKSRQCLQDFPDVPSARGN